MPRAAILPTVLLAAVATLLVACGMGRSGSYGTFVSPATGSEIDVVSVQRMPGSWGGEENVYVVRRKGGQASPRLEIDINGRFGDRLHVDVSRDAGWARVWQDIVPPQVGEQVPFDDGKGGDWYFKPYEKGGDVKPIVWPNAVVAYVDFSKNVVVRGSLAHSTAEERRTLFHRETPELPATQEIRGERVEWLPTTRK